MIICLYTNRVKEFDLKDIDLARITTYQAGTAQAAMNRVLQKKCDEILKPFGITKMQWLIIGNVLDAGKNGIRISDLADQIGTTIPYLTNALHLLESKNYIKKIANDNDLRSKMIKLNPKLISQCTQIESVLREGLRKSVYANIDPVEFRTYIKVMYQLGEV